MPVDPLGAIGGSLRIGADGDYVADEGTELMKKLILRRLLTPKGAFFHLPDYGYGLAVKEPTPAYLPS